MQQYNELVSEELCNFISSIIYHTTKDQELPQF